jgi:hypothetical protein
MPKKDQSEIEYLFTRGNPTMVSQPHDIHEYCERGFLFLTSVPNSENGDIWEIGRIVGSIIVPQKDITHIRWVPDIYLAEIYALAWFGLRFGISRGKRNHFRGNSAEMQSMFEGVVRGLYRQRLEWPPRLSQQQ